MNFVKINTLSTIREKIFKFSLSSKVWHKNNGFDILKIPNFLIELDSTLSYFVKKFNGIPTVFKMIPNTFYKFHVDEKRKCSINLLLSGYNSNCYFGELSESEEIIKNITELKYELDYYYIFNTQQKHAVLNHNNYRYLLSVGFNEYTYDDIVKNYQNETNF